MNAPLVGFGGTRVFPLGAITLSVMVGDYPQQITKDMTFLVVDYSSAYNAILGRPTLNSWKVVNLTYHPMIKFPTDYGVGELRGNQVAARECYITMLEMDGHQQTMCMGEQRPIAEPIEELEEVTLDNSRPKMTTRIGLLASWPVCQALTAFLSHEDMLGVDPSVIVHRLNMSPLFSLIWQKKRVFVQSRTKP